MSASRFPHIFYNENLQESQFSPIINGGSKNRIPERDREKHSQFLLRQFSKAWKDATKDAVSIQTRGGVYIEFRGKKGHELIVSKLDNRPQKIRLLSIREEGEDDNRTMIATVFIPTEKESIFLKKIQDYAEKETKYGKPKNKDLIESIEAIKLAVVESIWQDSKDKLPILKDWCEVWLRKENENTEKEFRDIAEKYGIEVDSNALHFIERCVLLVKAGIEDLKTLLTVSPDIAEFRLAKEPAGFWTRQTPSEQAEWINELLERIQVRTESNVSICVLDTGVNNGHPLLSLVLPDENRFTYNEDWGIDDLDGHGTLMVGLCGYGDLVDVLNRNDSILVEHILESAKILPPKGANPKELWGAITVQSISRAEIDNPRFKRIACLAITASDDTDRGRPSSWSGAIDAFTSGCDDDEKRLLIISTGNIKPDEYAIYPEGNITASVEDPAQSWNALTVGAFTRKTQIQDEDFYGYNPLAASEGLSPYTLTSVEWKRNWPVKPEIVMEGGNIAKHTNGSIFPIDDLLLLSTFHKPTIRPFETIEATSAASALAARLAAEVQVANPNAWPETIRGLLIHSAEWTEELKRQFLGKGKKGDKSTMLRICGYGTPNRERAIHGSENYFTLIVQQEIQPFEKSDSGTYRTKEMHLIELPWPEEEINQLGEISIEIRITLSYFIEPSPGEIGWNDKYRYPSHGLRFELQKPTESVDEFQKRVNKAAREEDESIDSNSKNDRWFFGKNSWGKGSLVSDRWERTATDIASSRYVAVYPTGGWWKLRPHLKRFDKKTRYSLIVSLHTPEDLTEIDIYTMIANQIGIEIPIVK